MLVRARPLNALERERNGDETCITLEGNSVRLAKSEARVAFDHVFGPDTTQLHVFDQVGPASVAGTRRSVPATCAGSPCPPLNCSLPVSYASLALAPWSTLARAWEPPVLLCLVGCTLGSMLFVVADVLSGYNATVFAYGQTASGKTFTMLVCWAPHGRVVGLAPGLRALCDRMVPPARSGVGCHATAGHCSGLRSGELLSAAFC